MQTDESLEYSSCIKCGNDDFSDISTYCKKCGTHRDNHCAAPEHQCDHLNPLGACYCELCGSSTFIYF